jgi:hypothetical protein
VEINPPSIYMCPSIVGDTFHLLYSIYIIYILHHLSLCHTSYLQYTFYNLGIKNGMLHSPPPTNCTVLSAHHHTIHILTYIKCYIKILGQFCNLMNHTIIPTNNSLFPSTHTSKGMVFGIGQTRVSELWP